MAMAFAVLIVNSVYTKYGVELVITSVNDGQHMTGSKHYINQAFDCRTKNITTSKAFIIAEIKENIGENFDVVFENEGKDTEHLHIELH